MVEPSPCKECVHVHWCEWYLGAAFNVESSSCLRDPSCFLRRKTLPNPSPPAKPTSPQ